MDCLFFNTWYTDAVISQKPERREKTVRSGGMEITRMAEPELDPGRNVVNVRYDFSLRSLSPELAETWQEDHPMRHFSIEEIEALAFYTGFQFLKAEEFLTGNPPSEHTWGGVIFLKNKISQRV